jgi:hypothetical protein
VFWTDAHGTPTIVVLDSNKGALVRVDPDTGETLQLWADPAASFLKGLVVVADVAYFGINPAISRQQRNLPHLVRSRSCSRVPSREPRIRRGPRPKLVCAGLAPAS